jgi:hypothetical protein
MCFVHVFKAEQELNMLKTNDDDMTRGMSDVQLVSMALQLLKIHYDGCNSASG